MKNKLQLIILLAYVAICNATGLYGQSWSYVGPETVHFAPWVDNVVCTDYIGNVYLGGWVQDTIPGMYTPGGHFYVSKWNGTRWYELKDHSPDSIHYVPQFETPLTSICTDRTGYLYAATYDQITKWDGILWHIVGWGDTVAMFTSQITSNLVADTLGNLYAGGIFTRRYAADTTIQDTFTLAKWDGLHWNLMDTRHITVSKLCVDKHNNLYGVVLNNLTNHIYVARRTDTGWKELGLGASGLYVTNIDAICADNEGNVYASVFVYGTFSIYMAKWDGTSWHNTGTYFNSAVYSLCADKNNNIYLGGIFSDSTWENYNVYKYDGTSFTQMGDPFHMAADTSMTAVHIEGFHSICLDTAGNVYGALWQGGMHMIDTFLYTVAGDTLNVVRYGTPFAIDTNILPPPDTVDIIHVTPVAAPTAQVQQPFIKVYPVPSREMVNIDAEHVAAGTPYRMTNIVGQTVLQGKLAGSHTTLNIGNMQAGLYMLEIGYNEPWLYKIMKQ